MQPDNTTWKHTGPREATPDELTQLAERFAAGEIVDTTADLPAQEWRHIGPQEMPPASNNDNG